MRGIRVDAVMTRDVYAVGPDTDLETVGTLLMARHISGVPVVDANGHAIGIISKTDLLAPRPGRAALAGKPIYYRVRDGAIHAVGAPRDGSRPTSGVARDVMSPYVFSVGPKMPLVDAMRLMVMDEVHRLVVVDDNRLVGILTSMDVLRALLDWASQSVSTETTAQIKGP